MGCNQAPPQGLLYRLGSACLTCSHTSTSWLADLRYSDSTATPTPRLNTALHKPNTHSQAWGTHRGQALVSVSFLKVSLVGGGGGGEPAWSWLFS